MNLDLQLLLLVLPQLFSIELTDQMITIMSTRPFSRRLSSLMVFAKLTVVVQSKFELGGEMKLLNDNKEFGKALQLFDKHKKNNSETCSSLIITQALKACAHLRDIRCGSSIHHLVSSRINDDMYILTSLIHMYSKCMWKTDVVVMFD